MAFSRLLYNLRWSYGAIKARRGGGRGGGGEDLEYLEIGINCIFFYLWWGGAAGCDGRGAHKQLSSSTHQKN